MNNSDVNNNRKAAYKALRLAVLAMLKPIKGRALVRQNFINAVRRDKVHKARAAYLDACGLLLDGAPASMSGAVLNTEFADAAERYIILNAAERRAELARECAQEIKERCEDSAQDIKDQAAARYTAADLSYKEAVTAAEKAADTMAAAKRAACREMAARFTAPALNISALPSMKDDAGHVLPQYQDARDVAPLKPAEIQADNLARFDCLKEESAADDAEYRAEAGPAVSEFYGHKEDAAAARSFRAVLELGKVDYNGSGRKACPVTVEINYTAPGQVDQHGQDREAGALSICGNIWNPGRSDIYTGGQCAGTIKACFPASAAVHNLVGIWARWHLNDMRAGCQHWENDLRARRAAGDALKTSDGEYIGHVYYLGANAAGEKWSAPEKEHAAGILCKPCPICGYKYGSAWKAEAVPPAVIADLLEICREYGAAVDYK